MNMPMKDKAKQLEYQREYQRKRRAENPEAVREYQRKYQNDHKPQKFAKEPNDIWCTRCGKLANKGQRKCTVCNTYLATKQNEKILRLKEAVFNHYGKFCACCGEKEEKFLSIDHVYNDGASHRKTMGVNVYEWLRNNNYPSNFQILCRNCNWGKYVNGGVCPHKTIVCEEVT